MDGLYPSFLMDQPQMNGFSTSPRLGLFNAMGVPAPTKPNISESKLGDEMMRSPVLSNISIDGSNKNDQPQTD